MFGFIQERAEAAEAMLIRLHDGILPTVRDRHRHRHRHRHPTLSGHVRVTTQIETRTQYILIPRLFALDTPWSKTSCPPTALVFFEIDAATFSITYPIVCICNAQAPLFWHVHLPFTDIYFVIA